VGEQVVGGAGTVDTAPAPAKPASGPSCPVRNSFTPETAVVMADGTTRPIEDIQVGQRVLATDPATGQTAARPVIALIAGQWCQGPGRNHHHHHQRRGRRW
jgi:hypothetical protein